MHRSFPVLLSVLVLVGASGCGGDDDGGEPQVDGATGAGLCGELPGGPTALVCEDLACDIPECPVQESCLDFCAEGGCYSCEEDGADGPEWVYTYADCFCGDDADAGSADAES